MSREGLTDKWTEPWEVGSEPRVRARWADRRAQTPWRAVRRQCRWVEGGRGEEGRPVRSGQVRSGRLSRLPSFLYMLPPTTLTCPPQFALFTLLILQVLSTITSSITLSQSSNTRWGPAPTILSPHRSADLRSAVAACVLKGELLGGRGLSYSAHCSHWGQSCGHAAGAFHTFTAWIYHTGRSAGTARACYFFHVPTVFKSVLPTEQVLDKHQAKAWWHPSPGTSQDPGCPGFLMMGVLTHLRMSARPFVSFKLKN